jgi:hypothetical protein
MARATALLQALAHHLRRMFSLVPQMLLMPRDPLPTTGCAA